MSHSTDFLSNYYKSMISRFKNEAELTNFLNQPDIINKFSDSDKEYFIVSWLEDNNYTEVEHVSAANEPDLTIKLENGQPVEVPSE